MCFPNYWSTMPKAMFTFLEHFDFTGITIKPFCTHEDSGQILFVWPITDKEYNKFGE